MLFVGEDVSEGIGKDGTGFHKRNTVLAEVELGLDGIPIESKRHPLRL